MVLTSLKRQFFANKAISIKTASVYSQQLYTQYKILDNVVDRIDPLVECIVNSLERRNETKND